MRDLKFMEVKDIIQCPKLQNISKQINFLKRGHINATLETQRGYWRVAPVGSGRRACDNAQICRSN